MIAVAAVFGFSSGAIISSGLLAITQCTDDAKNIGMYTGVGMVLVSLLVLVGSCE